MAAREILTWHKEEKTHHSDDGGHPLKKVPGEFWNPHPWRYSKVDRSRDSKVAPLWAGGWTGHLQSPSNLDYSIVLWNKKDLIELSVNHVERWCGMLLFTLFHNTRLEHPVKIEGNKRKYLSCGLSQLSYKDITEVLLVEIPANWLVRVYVERFFFMIE